MKILIIGSSVYYNASGGKVVRYIAEILKTNGHEVRIMVFGDEREDINDDFHKEFQVNYFYDNSKFRKFRHIINTIKIEEIKKILKFFSPDIVHFAPFDYSISRFLIEVAIKSKIKVILQPWIYNFFCHQMYAYMDRKACSACIDKGYIQSIKNHCTRIRNLNSIINRILIQKTAQHASLFLSSNYFMDQILFKYCVRKDKIVRFPIPYKIQDLGDDNKDEGDYFIFYGQVKDFKGIDILINVFKRLDEVKLKIYPSSFYNPKIEISSNILIVNNVSWDNGLNNAIQKSKAVIIPTLWPTTTEYTLYEAMNYRKAIIAFNIGAHKEILVDGYNAILIESGDEKGLKEGILSIDNDKEKRLKLGNNAYTTLTNITSPNVIYNKLMDIYS